VRSLFIAGLFLIVSGCGRNSADVFTTVKVKEVEQVGSYTYLLVKAKGPEYWIAVPSMEASPGETYHYQGGMLMKEFYSKELDRTFDEVVFLEALFTGTTSLKQESQGIQHEGKVAIEKADVVMEGGEETITIAALYADPGMYEGKAIRVKGKVTKFNASIMERNWVHIQDGTEYEGKFDLTATSLESFEVGKTVILEGTLTLNRDFGYGYTYELLLEEATAAR